MARPSTSALLILAIASAAFSARAAEARQGDDRRVVAVMRYYNDTGEEKYEHLGRAFSSMMISDLSVIDRIRLVERERIEELTKELDFQYSGYVDPESAQTVGLMIGAEWVVTGAFLTVDPEMRLDTRVANVETTEIVTVAEVTGQQESLFDLQQRLSEQVVQGLELVLTQEEEMKLRAQQEANRIDDLETMLKFSEALCLLDYGDYVEAAELLTDVQSAAPGSVIVRATLGLMRERLEDRARNALTGEVNRRIGGLLGRSRQPQRPPRPAQCG
jgi:TolB-like protein